MRINIDYFVTELFKKETGMSFVDRAETIKGLNIDSIELVALCMEVEEEYKIKINNEEVYVMMQGTVGDMIRAVEKKTKK